MILADTSVWVEYLHRRLPEMRALLDERSIRSHPWVTAEIALGNLRDRVKILQSIDALDAAEVASTAEVRGLIERWKLHGHGIGFVDAQLLAAALITGCRLWTLDRRLDSIALELGVSWHHD